MKTPFNKALYIGFIPLGIYQASVTSDDIQAASSFGIGLAFDPFDPNQKWTDRPVWQKVVLFVHLAIAAALLGMGIGRGVFHDPVCAGCIFIFLNLVVKK
jgi:O-antigen ligase